MRGSWAIGGYPPIGHMECQSFLISLFFFLPSHHGVGGWGEPLAVTYSAATTGLK